MRVARKSLLILDAAEAPRAGDHEPVTKPEVFKKYSVMLTGNALVGAEPSILHDWQKVFGIPWIQRDSTDRSWMEPR